MKKNKLSVGCSPINGNIYCGSILKDGSWSSNKVEVTDSAVSSVAQCLLIRDISLNFVHKSEQYKLSVSKVKN